MKWWSRVEFHFLTKQNQNWKRKNGPNKIENVDFYAINFGVDTYCISLIFGSTRWIWLVFWSAIDHEILTEFFFILPRNRSIRCKCIYFYRNKLHMHTNSNQRQCRKYYRRKWIAKYIYKYISEINVCELQAASSWLVFFYFCSFGSLTCYTNRSVISHTSNIE